MTRRGKLHWPAECDLFSVEVVYLWLPGCCSFTSEARFYSKTRLCGRWLSPASSTHSCFNSAGSAFHDGSQDFTNDQLNLIKAPLCWLEKLQLWPFIQAPVPWRFHAKCRTFSFVYSGKNRMKVTYVHIRCVCILQLWGSAAFRDTDPAGDGPITIVNQNQRGLIQSSAPTREGKLLFSLV